MHDLGLQISSIVRYSVGLRLDDIDKPVHLDVSRSVPLPEDELAESGDCGDSYPEEKVEVPVVLLSGFEVALGLGEEGLTRCSLCRYGFASS